jgi:NAD(P)-dependent dehydrogenase (short-subunit alcohol dehydrogenase family)
MNVKGSVALVTGANRGVGRATVKVLIEQGAAKVYATARDAGKIADLAAAYPGKVEALALDITQPEQVSAAAARAKDVSLLINNAGVNKMKGFIAVDSIDHARAEMEANYFGTLAMCRAFAPILKANGGGAIVNVITIVARVTIPMLGSYCASKWALFSMTQGVRAELAKQGTLVVSVNPGAIDTDMAKGMEMAKLDPADVARQSLKAVEEGVEDIYVGDMAQGMLQGMRADEKAMEKQLSGMLPM